MTIKKRGRGIFGALAATSAAIMLAFGGAAHAAPGDANSPLILPGSEGQPLTGTVTVHKHEQPDTAGDPANGLPQNVTTDTIGGVEFTAQQVESFVAGGVTYDLNLETNAGWHAASKLHYNADADSWAYVDDAANDPTGIVATPSFGTAIVQDTGAVDAYSSAVFADLPVGLYHFAETDHPVDVTPAVPWIMTVPLTHPENLNSWLYDLHVYPKNTTTSIEKTVEDAAGIKIGDPVTWTIQGDIPRTANPNFGNVGENQFLAPSLYRITDQLDGRLALNSVVVSLVDSAGQALSAPELTAADYTISPNPIPGMGQNRGQNVAVDFTEAGRDKLAIAGATPGAQVQVVIGTSVAALLNDPAEPGEESGIVHNQARLFPNESSVVTEGIPSDNPETRWGDILIRKADAEDNTVGIEGAVFSVFESKAAAEAGNNPISIGSGGQTRFTTDQDGIVRISGLRHSAWANGAPVAEGEEGYRTYWVVEVESPEDFELLAEPIEFIVDGSGVELAATQIENAPHNAGFDLPLTGGTGTAFLTLLGVGILAAVLIMARRRRAAEVSAD